MKILIVGFALIFSVCSFADAAPYDSGHFGVQFEHDRGYEAYGISFQSKGLYSFNNLAGVIVHHALILGVNELAINNVATNSNGQFEAESVLNAYVGLRVFNEANNLYGDLEYSWINRNTVLTTGDLTGLVV